MSLRRILYITLASSTAAIVIYETESVPNKKTAGRTCDKLIKIKKVDLQFLLMKSDTLLVSRKSR